MRIQSVQSFRSPTIQDYYRAATQELEGQIQNYSNERLIGTDTDELVAYFFQEYALSPLEIDEQRQIEYEQVTKKEHVQGFLGEDVLRDKTLVRLIFPLKPGLNIAGALKYHAQTFTMTTYEFDYDERSFTVAVEVEPERAEAAIQAYIKMFGERTADIQAGNAALRGSIQRAIEFRKKKITEDNQLFESLIQKVSIPLKRRDAAPSYSVPLNIRSQLQRLSVPPAAKPKELVLTSEQVASIIEIIDSDGRNFENTPQTYSKLEEPDLRNIILTHLNHYFPGDATGETFSGLGKADIRLKVFEGQILIAECKYWHGEKGGAEAIDQLFLYLTWRHNYGIVITFSRNQDFSEVLEKIKQTIQSHPSYKGGFTAISQTHFKSVHTFPTDRNKQIEIHHLVYNLYAGR